MSQAPVTFRVKKFTNLLGYVVASSFLLFAPTVLAQGVEKEVSVQRFDPAPGKDNFLTTRSAAVSGHLTWTAAMLVNYSYKPFVVKQCIEDGCPDSSSTEIPVVENMVTADLLGSLTLIDKIQIGLKLPVSWVKGQGITEDGQPEDGGLNAVGLGDIQVEAKGRFYGNPNDIVALGGYLYGTIPMGSITAEGSYIGNSSPIVGLSGVVSGMMGPLSWGANIGGIYRAKADIGGSSLGAEGRWSAGVGYQVSPIIRVVGDVFGSTNFSSNPGGNSIELDAAAQLVPLGNSLTFNVGAGAGLLKGVGVPTARAFLGVLYSAEVNDRDHDGLDDNSDACPDAPEDMDGFEDSDGCPEIDNDEDGIVDADDKCINEKEDLDDFEDKDGCPENDNDKDGIIDQSDHCPNKPENINDFEDLDGCPDVKDTDSDGVADEKDQCLNEPEDTDGFQDTDGCPDPDNDGDGIPDNADECIDEAEDGEGEGAELTDGCPLEGDDLDMDADEDAEE